MFFLVLLLRARVQVYLSYLYQHMYRCLIHQFYILPVRARVQVYFYVFRCIHLSNNSIQKHYKNAQRAQELPEENMWHCNDFKQYLQSVSCTLLLNNTFIHCDHALPLSIRDEFVCLTVYLQDGLENYEQISMNFWSGGAHGSRSS